MGNCQAAEAATVVIQHPQGRVERLYWPTTAEEIIKSNPGHHVALCVAQVKQEDGGGARTVRFTRIRLLKPKDMLLIGQVYKLITTQEVNKALTQRGHDKLKKTRSESISTADAGAKQENPRTKSAAAARQWRPSLQSISEGTNERNAADECGSARLNHYGAVIIPNQCCTVWL